MIPDDIDRRFPWMTEGEKACTRFRRHDGIPMRESPILLWEILVPDDKYRYGSHAWRSEIVKRAGGFTEYECVVGCWNSPEREQMVPIRIACTAGQIEEIADFTMRYYQQKAVMYYVVSDRVTIKEDRVG